MENENIEFIDNKTLSRFELNLGTTNTPFIDYTIVDGTYFLNYVKVPQEIEGRGYGNKIMKAASAYIVEQDKKAVGICSFASSYLSRNPLITNI